MDSAVFDPTLMSVRIRLYDVVESVTRDVNSQVDGTWLASVREAASADVAGQ